MASDRRRLGYKNLEHIRQTEEASELILKKVDFLLDRIKAMEPESRMRARLDLLEIYRQAADIRLAMGKIAVEGDDGGEIISCRYDTRYDGPK